jgi:hypothetical protein
VVRRPTLLMCSHKSGGRVYILFLPASIRSIPPGLHFALLLLFCCSCSCSWEAFNQTCQYFGRQLIRHDQTWSDMIRHDQTWSDMIRNLIRYDQTGLDTFIKVGRISADSWSHMIRQAQIFYQTCSDMFRHVQTCFWILKKYMDFLNIFWIFRNNHTTRNATITQPCN